MFRYLLIPILLLALFCCIVAIGCASDTSVTDESSVVSSSIAVPISLATTEKLSTESPSYAYGGEFIPARAGQGPNDIWLDNYECTPNVLIVKVGTTVTWTNLDFKPFAIVSETAEFVGNVDPGESWGYLFDDAGTFVYSIDPYPVMRGMIIVEE